MIYTTHIDCPLHQMVEVSPIANIRLDICDDLALKLLSQSLQPIEVGMYAHADVVEDPDLITVVVTDLIIPKQEVTSSSWKSSQRPPKDYNMTIHTHPSGYPCPSKEDVESLLYTFEWNLIVTKNEMSLWRTVKSSSRIYYYYGWTIEYPKFDLENVERRTTE